MIRLPFWSFFLLTITLMIADGIVKTMQKEAGPSSKELLETKDFEDFIAREGGCVVGKYLVLYAQSG